MDKKDTELVRLYAELTDTVDRFVYLREDWRGERYIEYAFRDGAPHDNRCLSWYDKLQPNALKRNKHDIDSWSKKLKKVGELYELNLFSCGRQNNDGDERCDAGHPYKKCREGYVSDWNYDEPVKCACWFLMKVDVDDIRKGPVIAAYNRTMKMAIQKAKRFISLNLHSKFTDLGIQTCTTGCMSQTTFLEEFEKYMKR